MKASIVDLRYRMNDFLRSLERNETVTILCRGKEKALLTPIQGEKKNLGRVVDHPFFGMKKDDRPVEEVMDELRGGRYRDL